MTRASDEPIRPMPTRAILLKWTVDIVLLQKLGQSGDDAAIGFFRSNRNAQCIGEAVTADATQDITAFGKPFVSLVRRVRSIFGKVDQQEIRDRRRYPKSELGKFLGQPAKPFLIIGDRLVDMGAVPDSGSACCNGSRVHVERSANAIDGVDDV